MTGINIYINILIVVIILARSARNSIISDATKIINDRIKQIIF